MRPPSDDALTQPLCLTPGLATVDRYRAAKMIQDRSFSILVDVGRFTSGDSGILVSHGSLGGGYELSIEGDELVWTHNARGTERSLRGGPVPPGTSSISAQIDAQPNHQWHIVLRADEAILADDDGFPAFLGMAPLEGIDIGRSRRSPVSWRRHCQHGAYPYRGSLRTVTCTCGPLAPDALELQVERLRARQITFD